MKFYIGRVEVALEYGELKSLIATRSQLLAAAYDSSSVKEHVDRLNELTAKLVEFEKLAEAPSHV